MASTREAVRAFLEAFEADIFATGVLPLEVFPEFVRVTPVVQCCGMLVPLRPICFPRSAFVAALMLMNEALLPGACGGEVGAHGAGNLN